METSKTLHLNNKLEELSVIQLTLDELGELWEIPMPTLMSFNLVLEEAFTNVVLYAFEDNLSHTIELLIEKSIDSITFVLTDDGKPYDPTLAADPDTSLALEDRAIGGLGIFFIRKMMDDVSYTWKEGRNVLSMRKMLA